MHSGREAKEGNNKEYVILNNKIKNEKMSDDGILKTERSARDLETIFSNSFITKLKGKEKDLEQFLTNNDPGTRELEKEVENLRKVVHKNFAQLNLDFPRQYRNVINETDLSDILISEDSDSGSETIEKKQKSAVPQKKIFLKPSQFQLEPKGETNKQAAAFASSTPFINSKGEFRVKFQDLLKENENSPTIKKELIESVKQHFSLETNKEILDSFFQQEEIEENLNNSIKKGFNFFGFVKDCREKLQLFLAKEENNDNKKSFENNSISDHFKSAINSFPELENKVENITESKEENKTENKVENKTEHKTENKAIIKNEIHLQAEQSICKNKIMSKTMVQIRGLSLKDALDLIPRFNGQNISLTQFLDGCQEALSILPQDYEAELAKLIRMRLYGDALNSVRGQNFKEISEITEFLETVYGSAKTFHDWEGELARIKQKSNETVIVYLNRLKEIESEIFKAAKREKRFTEKEEYEKELESDCIKFFLKGLRWEIRARMGKPATLKEARELALEVEREYACSVIEDDVKEENKIKTSRENKRVNVVNQDIEQITCAYCKRIGHGAVNCVTLAKYYGQQRVSQNNSNGQNGFNSNNFNGQNRSGQNNGQNISARNFSGGGNNPRNFASNEITNFGGWNAGNRRAPFLPNENNRNNGRNFDNYQNGRNFNNFQNNRINQNGVSGNRQEMRTPTCFYCGKLGHIQPDCFKYQLHSRRNAQQNQGNSEDLSRTGARRETENGARLASPSDGNSPSSTLRQ